IGGMPTIPRLIAFDLDDTLAPSKSPVDPRMLRVLAQLLSRTTVAVISGGNFAQFETQLVNRLAGYSGIDEASLARVHLLPTCGTRYERRENSKWRTVYQEHLDPADRDAALTALREEAMRLDLWATEPWGDILEDRGSQVTFS